MKNQNVDTKLGTVVLIIFTITALSFVWLVAMKTQIPEQTQVNQAIAVKQKTNKSSQSDTQSITSKKQSSNMTIWGVELSEIDTATFENIGNEYFYAKDKNRVYISDAINNVDKIKFDSETFKEDGIYIKDKNQVAAVYMSGGSYAIHKLIGVKPNNFYSVGGSFGRYENNIYYGEKLLKMADAESFTSDGQEKYIKTAIDKNNSYSCFINDVCGSGCFVENIKSNKKTIYYFGNKPTESECNQL